MLAEKGALKETLKKASNCSLLPPRLPASAPQSRGLLWIFEVMEGL